MKIEKEPFYYFSGEFYDSAFPVRCRFVKWLNVVDSPLQAIIARADIPFGHNKLVDFVLLPMNGRAFNDVPEEGVFCVYVFDVDERVQGETLNLSDGLKNVQDWAFLCFSLTYAKNHLVLDDITNSLGVEEHEPVLYRQR